MGDGSWDKSGSRLHLNNFHLNEVKRIQALSKFNIFSYNIRDRGYIIKIPSKEVYKVRELV